MRRRDLDELRPPTIVNARRTERQADRLTEHTTTPTGTLLEQMAAQPRRAAPEPLTLGTPAEEARGGLWLTEFEAEFDAPADGALATLAHNPTRRTRVAPASNSFREDAKPADTVRSAMVALYPSAGQAQRLAMRGGEPAEKLHVTLAYLGKRPWDEHTLAQVANTVRAWASGLGQLGGVISGAGVFTEGPDAPVTYLSVDVPALPALREELVKRLDRIGVPPSRDHSFTPHLTARYGPPDPDYTPPRGESIVFDQITLTVGDHRHDFPLAAPALMEACRLIEAALLDHAQRELTKAGVFDEDADYGGMLGRSVLKLVRAMEGQGHSGMSAQMALDLFGKLAKYEPLTPLTDDPGEWHDVSNMSFTTSQLAEGKRLWQSVRHPGAFSEDGGKTYTLLDETLGEASDGTVVYHARKPPVHTAQPHPVREGELTARRRRQLPDSAFAIPEKRAYPIHDEAHRANALARVEQHGTPDEKRRVRTAVAKRRSRIREAAAPAALSTRREDDPAYNWRRDTGKRGVTLRDGTRTVVDPETYDRLRRQQALDEENTPPLRGDVEEPDLEVIDGNYDETTKRYDPPVIYSAGERFNVGDRVTGLMGDRRIVGRLDVDRDGVVTVATRKVSKVAAQGEHLTASKTDDAKADEDEEDPLVDDDNATADPTDAAVSEAGYATSARPSHTISQRSRPARAVVQRGATGSHVRVVQKKVGAKTDGNYGAKTTSAVRAFQRRRGLQVDGIVGRQTSSAMLGNKSARKVKPGAMKTSQRRRLFGPPKAKAHARYSWAREHEAEPMHDQDLLARALTEGGAVLTEAWDPSRHPRGKTTPPSTVGSFRPAKGMVRSASTTRLANVAQDRHRRLENKRIGRLEADLGALGSDSSLTKAQRRKAMERLDAALPDFAGSGAGIESVRGAPVGTRVAYQQARSEAQAAFGLPGFDKKLAAAQRAKDSVYDAVRAARPAAPQATSKGRDRPPPQEHPTKQSADDPLAGLDATKVENTRAVWQRSPDSELLSRRATWGDNLTMDPANKTVRAIVHLADEEIARRGGASTLAPETQRGIAGQVDSLISQGLSQRNALSRVAASRKIPVARVRALFKQHGREQTVPSSRLRPAPAATLTRKLSEAATRSEDHPDWNWRRDGNGRRGVVLKDGRKVVVNGKQYDKLRHAGRLHSRTPALRGDNDTTAPNAGARRDEPSDGKVKQHTRRAPSGKVSTVREFVRKGQTGRQVQTVQRKVGAKADGKFGDKTAAAVKRFQAAHGLTQDGIVGHATTVALAGGNGRTAKEGALKGSARAKLARMSSKKPSA